MRPCDHLLVTEIPTGRQHTIQLKDLRGNGAVRFGRLECIDKESGEVLIPHYIQLGEIDDESKVDAHQWISKWQCSVFAAPREDAPGKWDYWLQDGAVVNGQHIPSSNGCLLYTSDAADE